jgi:hypothetical protein
MPENGNLDPTDDDLFVRRPDRRYTQIETFCGFLAESVK